MEARVLIIDDEDLFREDLAELLAARGGCVCRTAADGEEGGAVAQEFGPDGRGGAGSRWWRTSCACVRRAA
jgi:chemotaxis response regulator CheB